MSSFYKCELIAHGQKPIREKLQKIFDCLKVSEALAKIQAQYYKKYEKFK